MGGLNLTYLKIFYIIKENTEGQVMIEYGRIYKYTNLINKKVYIGQTKQSLKQRHKNHLSELNDNTYFHRAILKYGIENFKLELVEDNIPYDKLDEREKYWIQYYDSFYTSNKGYNLTQGGQWGSGTQILTRNQANQIQQEILNLNISFVDLANKYCVSTTCISDINTGRTFYNNHLKYPLRSGREHSDLNLKTFLKIVDMLQNTKETFEEIARINNVKVYTISIINRGLHSFCSKKYSYPLRIVEQKYTSNNILNKEQVIKIIYEICFSEKTLVDIGKQFHIAKNTIGDISRGITWKEITKQFKCPIRKNKLENQKIYQSIYGIV